MYNRPVYRLLVSQKRRYDEIYCNQGRERLNTVSTLWDNPIFSIVSPSTLWDNPIFSSIVSPSKLNWSTEIEKASCLPSDVFFH